MRQGAFEGFLVVASLLGLPMYFMIHAAQSQELGIFSCQALNSYRLERPGSLQPTKGNIATIGMARGAKFRVSIATGEMAGDVKSTTWAQTVVLDDGKSPRGSAFKAIYLSPPGGEFRNVAFLQVITYSEGSIKPFIYVESDEVATGMCG